MWYIFIMLGLAAGSSVKAQHDSLSNYLLLALEKNPAVKQKFYEYQAALQKIPQAGSLPDPELQFGYFLKPMELLDGNQVADIRIMQMFPWFGTLKAARDEMSKMAVAKFESFRDAKNELYFNVKASYYKVYRTKKEIEIAVRNLDILYSLEKLALAKFGSGGVGSSSEAGSSNTTGANLSSPGSSGMSGNGLSNQGGMRTGSMSSSANSPAMASAGGGMGGSMGGKGKDDMVNLLRAQIEINALENRIAMLKDQLTTDKVAFNSFLNRPDSSDVFASDSLTEMPIPADILTLADSLVNHPMVKMYEAESEASAAKLTMVTRMGYPMIGLGVNYNLIQTRDGNTSMMNGKDMIMPMASISLPIYRKKYNAMRREAGFMKEAAILSAENVTNDLRVNLQQTIQNLHDADRRVKLYSYQAMLADKSVQLLMASFSAGGTDFEEVLRMEQQLLDYQFKQVEAVVDKNSSIAQLVYLKGN